MKLSELLADAKAPFGAPKNLESIEIDLAKDVSNITFHPWIRESEEVFAELSNKYEDFSKNCKGTPSLEVLRSSSPEFFTIEFH